MLPCIIEALTLYSDQWNRMSHPLKKNNFGVWEITLPPEAPGVCAIPHDSKVKVSVYYLQ
jgi:1,4-alpha-glucan branching enzyme